MSYLLSSPSVPSKIRPTLLEAVTAYVKVSKQAESKLVPLVEEALDMLKTRNREQVLGEFREAFAKAHKIKEGEFGGNPDYAAFRMTSCRVVNVAAMGQEWFEERRRQGMSINAMYEQSKLDEPNEPELKKQRIVPDAKISHELLCSKNPDSPVVSKERIRGDGSWFKRCRYVAKNETEVFVKMIREIADQAGVPEPLINKFTKYILGEE